MGAKHAIVLPRWPLAKTRIHKIPDQFPIGRYREQTTEVALADQRVAVRQPLRDLRNEIRWQLRQAKQQHVAVA